jgi:hypothetical protein
MKVFLLMILGCVVLPVLPVLSSEFSRQNSCGLNGTLEERILECYSLVSRISGEIDFNILRDENREKYRGQNDYHRSLTNNRFYKLVTKTPEGQEFWLDGRTQLVWSPVLKGLKKANFDSHAYCPKPYSIPTINQYKMYQQHQMDLFLGRNENDQKMFLRSHSLIQVNDYKWFNELLFFNYDTKMVQESTLENPMTYIRCVANLENKILIKLSLLFGEIE